MKSPVYGTGRNYKHAKCQLRSGQAGSIKMRGRKVKLMSCGCCVCLDKRSILLKAIVKKELSEED